jgi:toxin ParE1/3/4
MKPAVIHVEARAELDEAIAYYESQKPQLGLDLQTAVEHAIEQIRRNPQLGALYKRTDIRYWVLRRFPYVIYYAELEQVIWVVAIAHGRRRPGYWKKRRP